MLKSNIISGCKPLTKSLEVFFVLSYIPKSTKLAFSSSYKSTHQPIPSILSKGGSPIISYTSDKNKYPLVCSFSLHRACHFFKYFKFVAGFFVKFSQCLSKT